MKFVNIGRKAAKKSRNKKSLKRFLQRTIDIICDIDDGELLTREELFRKVMDKYESN